MIAIVSLCTISICLFPSSKARAVEDDSIPRTSDIVHQLKPDEQCKQIPCGDKCCADNAVCCRDKQFCCTDVGSPPPIVIPAEDCE
ncbi:unnamed protein product [Nezara viridula]|uniref:Neuropeptide n=1 Tax=Nezara viridula TaxID=85310 RepID=A0A9P0HSF9_NEZVI|nr:unnamed protein product [Nezara viridula]